MSRKGIEILDDDEEADIVGLMLGACGIETRDFYFNEKILTREIFEKNYELLLKMIHGRKYRRAPYFVLGYLTLLTGSKLSIKLKKEILEITKWKKEMGLWSEEDQAIKRKTYLEDFNNKISQHKPGTTLHTASFKYNGKDFINSKVVVGINQFKELYESGEIYSVDHVNFDGWGLEFIPQEIFELKNLRTLSLEFNQIKNIPDDISELKLLKYLYLCYNQLKELPESIGNLTSLKGLNLIHNNLSTLPKTMRNLKNLKHIYVRGTKIKKAPKFIKNAKYDELNFTIYC